MLGAEERFRIVPRIEFAQAKVAHQQESEEENDCLNRIRPHDGRVSPDNHIDGKAGSDDDLGGCHVDACDPIEI